MVDEGSRRIFKRWVKLLYSPASGLELQLQRDSVCLVPILRYLNHPRAAGLFINRAVSRVFHPFVAQQWVH
jgi:hypothetical protein